jgi:16S rRNA (cytosine967-C5)-methyltransferase
VSPRPGGPPSSRPSRGPVRKGSGQTRHPRPKPSPPAPARVAAYGVLRRTFEEGAYADRALAGAARTLDARDRALATRLSFGAVQRSGTLDYLAITLSGRTLESMDPAVRAALRLGLYELLYQDGAAPHAVVSDAVELAKAAGSHGHGLVNAVLRRGSREAKGLLEEIGEATPEAAAITHAHPLWLVEQWWEELGAEETLALLRADNEPAESCLRVNTLRTTREELQKELVIASHAVEGWPEAIVLEEPFDAHGSSLWAQGAYMPMSRGAMLVATMTDPQPGERILDLCSAPGGKATHLAALAKDGAHIVAVERHPGRAASLRATCARMGVTNVEVQVADAAVPRPEGAIYDRVLVDPPCSGLGTLQARPDLRWRMTPERAAGLLTVQREILEAGAQATRPGGRLVYSTCTISTAENEGQIAALQSTHEGVEIDGPGGLVTLPSRDATAGFYIAVLKVGKG